MIGEQATRYVDTGNGKWGQVHAGAWASGLVLQARKGQERPAPSLPTRAPPARANRRDELVSVLVEIAEAVGRARGARCMALSAELSRLLVPDGGALRLLVPGRIASWLGLADADRG